jgi:flagellar basal body-associated protein FliL
MALGNLLLLMQIITMIMANSVVFFCFWRMFISCGDTHTHTQKKKKKKNEKEKKASGAAKKLLRLFMVKKIKKKRPKIVATLL